MPGARPSGAGRRTTRTSGSGAGGTDGSRTLPWREPDSNHRSRRERDGPAADHRRLARRPVLNDPIQVIGPASLVGDSERPFTRAGPMVRIRFPPAASLQTFGSWANLEGVVHFHGDTPGPLPTGCSKQNAWSP